MTLLWITGSSLFALIVYCITLAPGLTFIDSGELAAVCSTPGIAHPTGYPLYTLLGWLCTRLPTAARPVYLLNLLSAVCSAGAAVLLYCSLSELFLNGRRAAGTGMQQTIPRAVCAAGALLFAFCGVVWSSAVVTEVYALQGLFICALLLVSIKLSGCAEERQCPAAWLYGAGFVLGLGLCNHLSTVLILPALVYLVIARRAMLRLTAKKSIAAAGFFILGLVPYLYLPLRAAHYPALNWGNPQTPEGFLWHVTGRQYRVWMFSSIDVVLRQMEYFIGLAAGSFGYVPVLLIPFGLWYLYRRHRQVFWFSLLFFTTDIFYAVNYDINDIDPYFLPALVMCCLWMSGGLMFFGIRCVNHRKKGYRLIPYALCLAPCFPLVLNYHEADQSKNQLVEQYTGTILKNLGSNALVLSYQWDYFCSAIYYLQLVEGQRPDVTMIEVKLLKRSWYLTQLQKNYPALIEMSAPEVAAYSRELYKFEHNQPYDGAVIERCYMNLINSFIRNNITDRPVYLTCELEKEIGAGLHRIPEGLVFRLYPEGTEYRSFDLSALSLPAAADFKREDRYHTALKSFYAFMLASRGLYELHFKKGEQARGLIQKAQTLYPDHPAVTRALARIADS